MLFLFVLYVRRQERHKIVPWLSVSDVLVMRRYLAGKTIVENINIDLADAFEDGRINAKDLLVIKKILAA